MARDRLAALRAQQQGGGVTSDYPPSRANVYAQDDGGYEMGEVKNHPSVAAGGTDTMSAFYDEISSIQDSLRAYNDNVTRIADLHNRSLNTTDDSITQRNNAELEELVADTSALSNVLKRRIKALEKQGAPGRDGQIRKQQTGLVKSKFVEAIQNYQTEEQQFRQKYKQRLERQYKIVKPDATPEELRTVVEEDNGGQVFSQALMNSNRYGESRAAYREVQERHADIQKIERTLTELAQLFNDMSILVEQQDDTINVIETTAAHVEKDTEAGLTHTDAAVKSARAARKKRWICFIIALIILAVIAIVVGVVVSNNVKKSSRQFHKLMSEQEPLLPNSDPEAGASEPDNASFTERTARHLESQAFHRIVIALIVIDSACVLADLSHTLLSNENCPAGDRGREPVKDPIWLEILSHISLVITTLFLVEIPLQVWAFGLQYFNPLRGVRSLDSLVSGKGGPEGREAREKVTYGALHLFDACVIIMTFVLEVALKGRERELAGLLVLLRLWRLVKLVGGVAVGAGEISEEDAQQLVDTKRDLQNTKQALAEALEKNRILTKRLGSAAQKPNDEDDPDS